MKTVLLIDDDQALRQAMALWFHQAGWEVLEADNGVKGLEMAAANHPQLVLCDLLMPRCNGFEFCRRLRAEKEPLSRTAIIVTSGSSYSTDRQNALEAGANDYLLKPVNFKVLSAMLEHLLGAPPPAPVPAEVPPPVSIGPARVKFWGVRGSVPTPGADTLFYGGNTACVEVRTGGAILILDAGTGIRRLGLALRQEFKDQPLRLNLLISHTHWDHIQGFPFFMPAYDPKNSLFIYGFEGARQPLRNTLTSQMESSYFPVSLQQMPGNISIHELKELSFLIDGVPVQAHFLNHPGICSGYRIQTSAGAVSYLSDVELFARLRSEMDKDESSNTMVFASRRFADAQDRRLLDFVRESEVLIFDAQYDVDEYKSHVGWGHTCMEDSVTFAIEAKVKRLFLFHHDPEHDDERITRMVNRAREIVAQNHSALIVEAAREGLEVVLEPVAQ